MKKITIKKLKEIGNFLLTEHGTKARIKFKNIQSGRATSKGHISIPKWSLGHGEAFSIYYVIHEVCHIILYSRQKGWGHNEDFRNLELQLLARFDIVPIYSKAYPKRLTNKEGKILYLDLDK